MLVYSRVLLYAGLWPGTAVYWSMAGYCRILVYGLLPH